MPYMRYQVMCSSNNCRFCASVRPSPKRSAVRMVPMKNVECAQ